MASTSALKEILLEDVGCKGVDNALDKLNHLFQSFNNRVTLKNLALTKRYLKHEMRVCVVLRFVEDPARKFVAVFQRKSGFTRRLPWREWFNFSRQRELNAQEIGGNWNNRSVFVYIVEPPETEQVVCPTSFVRFEVADHFFRLRPNAPKKILELAAGKGRLPTYRKVGVSHYLFGKRQRFDATMLHQRKCERIERGNRVMCDVADLGTEVCRNTLLDAKSVDLDRGFRILICNDRIWIATTEGFNRKFEISKVLVSAVDFNSATEKRINGHGEASKGLAGVHAGANERILAPAVKKAAKKKPSKVSQNPVALLLPSI